MGKDNLQTHLDKAMYGTPLLKPEEQHRYLGTFRERCYLTMTIAQMSNPTNKAHFLAELTHHPQATVLLNGAMSSQLQSVYIKLVTEHAGVFTIVNDFVTDSPDSLGLVLTAKEAVNEPVIAVDQKYPSTTTVSVSQPAAKNKFWHKLFYTKEQK